MRADQIAEISGRDLEILAAQISAAVKSGRRVSFTVEDGLKWKVGGDCWTPSHGSLLGEPVYRIEPGPGVDPPTA